MKTTLALFGILSVGCSPSIVAELKPAAKLDETRQITGADLPALMAKHKPPYAGHGQPVDPAITFDRVDVIIEGGIFGPRQTPYLSIGHRIHRQDAELVDVEHGRTLIVAAHAERAQGASRSSAR